MTEAGAEVLVGVVGKPLGLRGEVYVRPDADLPGDILSVGRVLRVRPPAGDPGDPGGAGDHGEDGDDGPPLSATPPLPPTLEIVASREHARRRVVRFAGVDSREAAEALRNLQLTVSRAEVPLDAESFWAEELLGREVVDDAGAVVGVLEAVADGTAHDYLVVARPDGGELLIPAVAELVTVEAEAVVVHAIPGLLDPED